MRFIADFHIHSHYSRATSKEMNIVSLTKWSQLKGANVVGTGDFTHPQWLEELEERLTPAEQGLFRLSPAYEKEIQREVPETCRVPMRFVLSVEISTIYKKNDRVRKVHSVILAPSFDSARRINARLQSAHCNISSDGRPIIGMHTKELLKLVLDASEDNFFIPAHIWTPHFSLFGSASGYDSIEECFEELSPHIYAVETGLSSDPLMNARIRGLDHLAVVSNSDAHSARKLGREANIFNTELSYGAITKALMTNDRKAFESTIEFYPEEGKYHLDGHRDCETRLTPTETKKNKFLCPKCGRKVTVGVMHRVDDLADSARPEGYVPKKARPFAHIVPLPEIISEVEEVGVSSKRVDAIYFKLLNELGNEFYILLEAPLSDIEKCSSSLLALAVERMREGKIHIAAGYDGEFGTISIFSPAERRKIASQQSNLF